MHGRGVNCCKARTNFSPCSRLPDAWSDEGKGRTVMVICRRVVGLVALAFLGWVQVAEAAPQDLNCLIQPFVVITITTPVGGLLETVQVDRGDLVKEGQILATLDTSVERATGSVQ